MKDGRIFQIGETICGFRVVRVRKSKETGGSFIEFEHEKTGAELAFCDNNEENKLFCVAFKTLPEDSTGVFHILEHSVLCGSGKFPVKEPFVELLKSSMNTFLNAMTYQDKTVYPVSSRNDKDFLNLTEVYLDAVFDPAILTNPNIFYQEGRHIEQDENGGLSYKGVVFNEMKGALSDVDDLMSETIISLLFPGSPYGVNSGGDPEHIPELTYEKFIDTYKKYYHPSNSRIYIDGAVPLEKTLGLIDSYLSRFDRGEKIPDPAYSKSETRSATIKYELSETEPIENRGILALSRIIGTWEDKLKCMAAGVVSEVLLGSNSSPLKSRVLESGLAQDIWMYTDSIELQPYTFISCRNVVDGKEEELKKLICDAAIEIAEEGIDRDLLQAAISRYEFRVREQEEPRALRRALSGLTGWLHGGDPLRYMEYDEDFAALRKMMDEGGFEELVKEMFDAGQGLVSLLALPDYGEGDRLRAEENERLEAVAKSWTAEDREENRKLNEKLSLWQQTPDSQEAIATIPVLDLSEVETQPFIIPTDERDYNGVTVLDHRIPSNGIYYANLYFNISDLTLEELTVLSRADQYYGTLSTEKYDALTLRKEINKKLGRFQVWIDAKSIPGEERRGRAHLAVSFGALKNGFADAAALVAEILLNTSFDDADKIREIALQNDESVKQMPVYSGNGLGITQVLSHYSSSGAIAEAVAGRSMILYSHSLAEDFDERVKELRTVFAKLKDRLTQDRLVIGLTGTECPDAGTVIDLFPKNSAETGAGNCPESASFVSAVSQKQGLPIPAQIGFAVQGYNVNDAGVPFDGTMPVAAQIVSLDYLWNKVRVQGGAYGAGIAVRYDGNMFTYTYRDPSPDASLEVNKGISAYLRSLRNSGVSLDKYIISTLTEPLMSPRQMGSAGDSNWFSGITPELLRKVRREGLMTTWEDLNRFADIIDRFCEEGSICVVAYKDALDRCEGLDVENL